MNAYMRIALYALGYRLMRGETGKWGKPIGWHLLTFEEDRFELTLWFIARADDEPHRIDAKSVESKECCKDALLELKKAEATVLTDYNPWRGNHPTSFEFMTSEQIAELVVDKLWPVE